MLSNEELMRSALHEALKGGRAVRPNPRVGCAVELRSGELLLGHHSLYGGPHAERVALSKLNSSQSLRGARVAVTLEPCSHTGKTPPCVEALIAAGVSEVIIPFLDPNPLVRGQGVHKLKAAGIRVVFAENISECFQVNREWLWSKVLKRPFVTLKMATSKNFVGVATQRKWITSLNARQHAMKLRARADVLLTSGATVRNDDPALTVRNERGEASSEQQRVIVYSKTKELGAAKRILQHPHWEWHHSEDLLLSLSELAREGVFDVMVEAGPELSKKFFEADLVDEVWHYEAQCELEGKSYERDFLSDFELVEKKQIDDENSFFRYLRLSRTEKNYFSHFSF